VKPVLNDDLVAVAGRAAVEEHSEGTVGTEQGELGYFLVGGWGSPAANLYYAFANPTCDLRRSTEQLILFGIFAL